MTSHGVQLFEGPGGSAVVALSGPLDVRTAPGVRQELRSRLSRTRPASLEVDASGIERGDMSGMVILYELAQGRFTSGVPARLVGLRPELQKILSSFCSEAPEAGRAEGVSFPERVGGAVLAALDYAGGYVVFTGGVVRAFGAVARRPRLMRWSEVARIFEAAGVDALPIVSLISLLTGLVIAFEAAQPLAAYGAEIYVANTIGRVMVRELGPIMTAVLLAGRSGSAFAAELGTMKVNEELDALETMGLRPLRFLVIQRIAATTLLTPLLTAYAMALGIMGGVVVMLGIGFSWGIIWAQLVSALRVPDVLVGLVKALVFGAAVSAIGCHRGMETRLGPTAVGQSTTHAVVAALLTIVVIDSIFALLAYLLHV